jgi:ABC-2 type transport system ATP-binding protein
VSDRAELAVDARDLSFAFGSVRAVVGVSFDVTAGEIFGLLGPNGAGKTTTIRLLTTLLEPEGGSILVFGVDARRSPMRVRRAMGYVPQQLSIDAQLTGAENVWLFARLFDVPRAERTPRIDQALELVGLRDVAGRLASTYSGGMIRRLEIAQALVNRPRMLVMDEPTIGLDPIARGAVWRRLLDLRSDRGMTIIVTTHYMEEADELCDRVGIMHHGRLRAIGTPDELKRAVSPGASLDDVFRTYAGDAFGEDGGSYRDVRGTRRTAGRVG